MSDAWLESCGLKKRKSSHDSSTAKAPGLSREDRLDLFEDLLEEDTSVFPLLDVPPEVLTTIGIFLDAGHLTALSQLNARAETQLGEALADAWAELLLRDYAFQSRAKRYRAYSAAAGEAQRARTHSAGLLLTAVDLCRIEWDGMLVAAPYHLRYRFLQTLGALKSRWGRMAQSWEWFCTRVMHRMTHGQLERLVPGYRRQQEQVAEDFDEVSHQASMDRDLRQRHPECNPKDVIASMKRSLGLSDEVGRGSADRGVADNSKSFGEANAVADGAGATTSAATDATTPGATACEDDVLSALAPTARDQRMQQAQLEAEKAAAAAAGLSIASAGQVASGPDAALHMPPQEVIERMSFAEQLDLAMKVSQAPGETERPKTEEDARPPSTTPSLVPAESTSSLPSTSVESAAPVLFQLKGSRHGREEALEVVIKDFTVGEKMQVPEVLRRPLEQVTLRLARGDWLLLYESIDAEAKLRARAVAHHCRVAWLRQGPAPVRRRVDLEAELLQLPIFARSRATEARHAAAQVPGDRICTGSGPAILTSVAEEEAQLWIFLEAWEEHEAWAAELEEHLGPLDLEISRERANNLQHGRAHTPFVADLCRLAFRNFAICEGRLFFALALAVYNLIARLVKISSSGDVTDGNRSVELLEGLCAMAEVYSVQDDALASQRNTLWEYRYYLLEPLQRARAKVAPEHELGMVEDEEEDFA